MATGLEQIAAGREGCAALAATAGLLRGLYYCPGTESIDRGSNHLGAAAGSPAAEYIEGLNLAEQVARIERAQEETRKFVAEQHKLMAEGNKLNRDRWLAPWIAVFALVGGVGGTLAGVATFVRLLRGAGAAP